MPRFAAVCAGGVRDVDALEGDAARARPVGAGDAVQQAGLAGAVRADDGHQLALLDGERYIIERLDAAERQRDMCNVENRRHPHHLRLRRYCLTSR